MVRDLLKGRDDLSDTSRITSISFAQTPRAFAANQTLSRLDDGARRAAGDPHVHPSAGSLEATVNHALRGTANNTAVTSIGGTHVEFGVINTARQFERLVALRAGGPLGLAAWSVLHPGATLQNIGNHALVAHPGATFAALAAHELQHTSTYLSYRDIAHSNGNRLDWLVEGAAVRAEGRLGHVTASLIGTSPNHRSALTQGYYNHYERTERVLALAGAPGTAGDALLAGASGEVALDRIVERIATRHPLTAVEKADVRAKLHTIDTDPRQLGEVEAMLKASASL